MPEFIRSAAWVMSSLVGCLWVTIGLLLAGIGWSTMRKCIASARWHKVPARIVSSVHATPRWRLHSRRGFKRVRDVGVADLPLS